MEKPQQRTSQRTSQPPENTEYPVPLLPALLVSGSPGALRWRGIQSICGEQMHMFSWSSEKKRSGRRLGTGPVLSGTSALRSSL